VVIIREAPGVAVIGAEKRGAQRVDLAQKLRDGAHEIRREEDAALG
jgi:hypothetical protein